jgi:hypothetical protein
MKCKADSSHKYGHYFVFFKTLNVNVLIVLKYKSAFMLNIFCFHFITTKASKPICFLLWYLIVHSYWSKENPTNLFYTMQMHMPLSK